MYHRLIPDVDLFHEKIGRSRFLREPRKEKQSNSVQFCFAFFLLRTSVMQRCARTRTRAGTPRATVCVSRQHWLSVRTTRSPSLHCIKNKNFWGAWLAQSVKRPTSAQVMISWFVSSSPASGSGLMAQSLEPASDSVSPSLSAPPPLMLCLSVSLSHSLKNK